MTTVTFKAANPAVVIISALKMSKKLFQVLILIVCTNAFLPSTALTRRNSTKQTLYRPADKVVTLSGTTVTETVFGSDKGNNRI